MHRPLVNDVQNLIRHAAERLPLEPLENEYPVIDHNDVHITNEMWKCPGFRKLHIEVGHTKHLEVMHCVWYPDPAYNLPIFGADIVDNGKIVTAAIVDVSPVKGVRATGIYDRLVPISNEFRFKDRRILPLWGDEIFSPICKFARLNTYLEKAHYWQVVQQYLKEYVDLALNTERDDDWVNEMLRLDDQIYYCTQQKKNTKTIAVLSQWFGREWAENYIDTILFDEPVVPAK